MAFGIEITKLRYVARAVALRSVIRAYGPPLVTAHVERVLRVCVALTIGEHHGICILLAVVEPRVCSPCGPAEAIARLTLCWHDEP